MDRCLAVELAQTSAAADAGSASGHRLSRGLQIESTDAEFPPGLAADPLFHPLFPWLFP